MSQTASTKIKEELDIRMKAKEWFDNKSNFRKSILCSLYTDVKNYFDLQDYQIEDIYRKYHKI